MLSIYPHSTPSCPSSDPGNSFFSALGSLMHEEVMPFSSARAAMLYGLRALGLNREDEILVPPYMSHCVLSAITHSSFPVRTPSPKTKAILVYHQFGFPQALSEIDSIAAQHGWTIVNDCANTIFSRYGERPVTDWGDVVALSLSKLYPIEMGGAIVCRNEKIRAWAWQAYAQLSQLHQVRSNLAYEKLERIRSNPDSLENRLDLEGVFGYLPELVAFPEQAYKNLPPDQAQILADKKHRESIWEHVRSRLPDLVPMQGSNTIVPFAIPVRCSPSGYTQMIAANAKATLGVDIPVLHFDFAQNMLDPAYHKALILGCHVGWSLELIDRLCTMIEKA